MVTQERLKDLFIYDPETGIFTRRKNSNVLSTIRVNGYMQVKIDGKSYLLHRLAWLYEYGEWPNTTLDHINCLKADNRISNLREISQSENNLNTFSKRWINTDHD